MSAPDDYNPHRRNKTWREANGWSDRAAKKRDKQTKQRRKNRQPGRFGKVNWNAYQHEQLYDMIWRANIGDMSARSTQWSSLAGKIEATTTDVQRVMERVMGAWRGQAAVASAESNTRLMTWAGTASQTASKIADGMATYTDAVGTAQSHMPDPAFASAERNFRNGYTVTSTGGPSTAVLLNQLLSDGMVSHEKARASKAEAVRVMEAYEQQSKDVHDTMPQFTEAGPTTNQAVGDWSPPPRTPDQPVNPGPGQTPPTPYGTGTPTPLPLDESTTTTASGFANPALPGGPTSGVGGGQGPGGTSFGGGLGSLGSGGSDVVRNSPGFGALSGGGAFPGGGGAAGVGAMPGGGRGAAGAGALMNGARGAGGAGAFGGMPLGGSGAQGEEDGEHRNKYDQGMDFLDDLPPAYPPVFGA